MNLKSLTAFYIFILISCSSIILSEGFASATLITTYQIITHNFEPGTASVATAYLSFAFPQLAPVAIEVQAILGGIACYFGYKKYKKIKLLLSYKRK